MTSCTPLECIYQAFPIRSIRIVRSHSIARKLSLESGGKLVRFLFSPSRDNQFNLGFPQKKASDYPTNTPITAQYQN